MEKYNILIRDKIKIDGVTYLKNVFNITDFYYIDGSTIKCEILLKKLIHRANYLKKIKYLYRKIEDNIKTKKINQLLKKFPIGSRFYHGEELYVVQDIFCNDFMSSEHSPNYNLDRHYSINPRRTIEGKASGSSYPPFSVNITECVSQKELRLKKLSRIWD